MLRDKRASCKDGNCPSLYEACLWRGSGDKPAHIIVVDSAPSSFSVGQNRPFLGHKGKLFKNILDFVKGFQNNRYADVKVYYTYATLAALPAGAKEPPKAMLDACRPNLINDILSVRGAGADVPVIVTLGPVATRAVGLSVKNIYDAVGRVFSLPIPTAQGIRNYSVVPLMSMRDMEANQGKINVEVASLLKAVKLATEEQVETKGDLDKLTVNYQYPQTIEEVTALVDHIIDYYVPETNIGPDNWLISIDTETNTVHPHREDAKALMISVAWDTGKAATILLDHPDCPYDREAAWEQVVRLLSCPKPKTFHNAKFDWKILTLVHGTIISRIVWDTLLGEHYLDEDKKGLYSLKKLTTIYTPAYEGYDEMLQEVLRASDMLDEDGRDEKGNMYITDEDIVARQNNQDIPDWIEEAVWSDLAVDIQKYEELKQKNIPGWVNPVLSQRLAALFAQQTNLKKEKQNTSEVKKQISELKKSLKDDVKLIKSELRESIRDTRTSLKLKKPTKKTQGAGGTKRGGGFENIPLPLILQYAAVDGDVTRMITKQQMQRIHKTGLREEGNEVMRSMYLPATTTLGEMEFHGVKVDYEHLDNIEKEITELRDRVQRELEGQFDPTINYNSPAQVAPLMQRLNFPAIPGIDTGSTKNEALEKYVEMFPEDDVRHILCSKLMEYRSAEKALGGFLVKLRRLSRADGRIHCSFNINGTSTGRLCVSGDTLLDTSHGTFCISELDLQKIQNVTIMTHTGKAQKILRKFFKGFEKMVRVVLDDGSFITCTQGHQILSPVGWRSVGDLSIGSKVCGVSAFIKTHKREKTCSGRVRICSDRAGRGTNRKRNEEKVQHQSPCVAHIDGSVPNEIQKRGIRSSTEKLRSVKIREQTRKQGHVRTAAQIKAGKIVTARVSCRSNCTEAENHPVVCSSESPITRPFCHQGVARANAGDGLRLSKTIGTIGSWDNRFSESFRVLRESTQVFQRVVSSFCTTQRVNVVYPGTSKVAQVLRRKENYSTGPHLLVSEQKRASTVSSTFISGGGACSGIHILQELPSRLLVPKHKRSCGSRWGVPQERHQNDFTGQTKNEVREKTKLQSTSFQHQRGTGRCSFSGTSRTERTVVSIEDAGTRGVWDIEVETDHSYVAQGMIHHNSSSGPNLQNIPKIMCDVTKKVTHPDGRKEEIVIHPGYNIKKVFVPTKPGHKIVNMDIRGAELRVYPVYSKDQKMIDALLNGDDVHSITCAQVYNLTYEEVMAKKNSDPDIIDKRDRAKRVIFGTFYGAGPWKIAQQIGCTVEEAEKVQEGLFNAFPALRAYVNYVKNEIRTRQFVQTVMGRRRRFKLAHLGGKYYSSACREAVNFLIQSTASDILLGQLCEMSEPVKTELNGQLLLTVHDSVVLQLPDENVPKLKPFFDHYITERVAEKYEWMPVPFLYDYEVGDNYGEVYKEKDE